MNDFIDLRRVFVIILRKWWLLALAIVIGAGLGYGVAKRQAKVYQATTTLLVGQIVSSSDLNRQDILAGDLMAKTYREMIMREPVLQGVVDALDLNLTWQQLSKRIKVTLVEGTQLIQITAEANSADSARIVADEVAQQLILFSPTVLRGQGNDSVQPFVQQQLNSLQSRIDSGQSRLAALQTEMLSTDSSERLSELQAEANGLESLITDWENNYTQLLAFLQSGQSINQLAVVEAARANPNPIRPQVQIYVIVATALAIFTTLGLIFTLDYFNNTVRGPEEITREFGLSVLGSIDDPRHYGENKKSAYASKFLVSPIAEAYRSLRANLEMVGAGKSLKSILITSCDAGVGKSSLSANLAAFLAQAGRRVILIDADLRKPSLHAVMGLTNSVGLSNIITNGVGVSKALQPPKGDRLRVITAGAVPGQINGTAHEKMDGPRAMMMGETSHLDPSEILVSDKVDKILAKLEEDCDVLILDSPPFIVSDALILAAKVDGVLLVVQPGRTLRKSIHNMMEQLNRADARVIGVVLNYITAANARKMIGLPYPSLAPAVDGQAVEGDSDGTQQRTADAPEPKPTILSFGKASSARLGKSIVAIPSFARASSARRRKREEAGEGGSAEVDVEDGRMQAAAGELENTSELTAGIAGQAESASVQAGEPEAEFEGTVEAVESRGVRATDAEAAAGGADDAVESLSVKAADAGLEGEAKVEPVESLSVKAGEAGAAAEGAVEAVKIKKGRTRSRARKPESASEPIASVAEAAESADEEAEVAAEVVESLSVQAAEADSEAEEAGAEAVGAAEPIESPTEQAGDAEGEAKGAAEPAEGLASQAMEPGMETEGAAEAVKGKNGRKRSRARKLESTGELAPGIAEATESAVEEAEVAAEGVESSSMQAGEIWAEVGSAVEAVDSLTEQAGEEAAQIEDSAESVESFVAEAGDAEVAAEGSVEAVKRKNGRKRSKAGKPESSSELIAGVAGQAESADEEIDGVAEPVEGLTEQAGDAWVEAQGVVEAVESLTEAAGDTGVEAEGSVEPVESLALQAEDIGAEAESTIDIVAEDGSGGEEEGGNSTPLSYTDLTDEQWERVSPLIPVKKTRAGYDGPDDRAVLNGILWIRRTGAPWPALPEQYGKHERVHYRYRHWQNTGVWERILEEVETWLNNFEVESS